MQKFLVKPLQSAAISTVIVIDALDECRDENPESAILLVLGQSVSEIPGVKFFITSRPDTHLATRFRDPLLKDATNVFILHEVEPRMVDNDIRRFFKHELAILARQRRESDGGRQTNRWILCVEEQPVSSYTLLQRSTLSNTGSNVPRIGLLSSSNLQRARLTKDRQR